MKLVSYKDGKVTIQMTKDEFIRVSNMVAAAYALSQRHYDTYLELWDIGDQIDDLEADEEEED